MEPIGFTLVCVQMPHYDKQQVAFILDDLSRFSARIPFILGTPTINRFVQIMKESDIHDAPTEWQAARVVYEWKQGSWKRTYTELKDGSQNVTVVLWNLTGQPIHLARGHVIGHVMAANSVLEAQCSPKLLKKLEKEDPEVPQPIKLMVPQRQELLLASLKKDDGLDCLKDWLPELTQNGRALLLEFHHIFSLEPNEIGCTNATEHIIKLLKD